MPPRQVHSPKGVGKRPRLLNNVLQAISDLGEAPGSTTRAITNQVQGVLNASRTLPRIKDVSSHVERALRYAINAGVIVLKHGRFKLSGDSRTCRRCLKRVAKFRISRGPKTIAKRKSLRKTNHNKVGPEKPQDAPSGRKGSQKKKPPHEDSDTETSFASTTANNKNEKPVPKKNTPNMAEEKEKREKPRKMDFISCPLNHTLRNIPGMEDEFLNNTDENLY